MRALRWLAIVAVGILGAVGAMPGAAHATWLGLEDGTYDVTLTCTQSSTLACPITIQGTVTIAGSGASFMSFAINGETFSGDPVDDVFDGSLANYQSSQLSLSPYSFISLRFDLGPNQLPQVPDEQWWLYCENVDIDSCTPTTIGSWTAALDVPEPFTLALFAAGLAGLGLTRRRSA